MYKAREYDMYDAATAQFERQLKAYPGGEFAIQRELQLLEYVVTISLQVYQGTLTPSLWLGLCVSMSSSDVQT